MKLLKTLLLLALPTIILIACKQKTEKATVPVKPQPVDIVRGYYNKAEKLKLPLSWDKFIDSKPNSMRLTVDDTLTFGSEMMPLTLLGAFPDTSKYFGFLLAYYGDDVGPVLATFNKKGQKISFDWSFGYGCGGSDCEYICNSSDFIIEKNLHFHSITKSYIKACEDDTDNMDTTQVEYNVVEIHSRITPTGKIKVDKEKTVEHKTWLYGSPENPLK